ncbi:hypothetical protein MRX96_056900 [Rhipicephalus microplus]
MALSTKASLKESSRLRVFSLADMKKITDNYLRQTIHHAWPLHCDHTTSMPHHSAAVFSVEQGALPGQDKLSPSPRTRTGRTLIIVKNPYVIDHSLFTLHHVARLFHLLFPNADLRDIRWHCDGKAQPVLATFVRHPPRQRSPWKQSSCETPSS